MDRTGIRLVDCIHWSAIVVVDILVFVVLGHFLMGYDDNYDSSKGEYWSLESMTATEKAIYICYNCWIALNILGLAYLGFRLYRQKGHGT